MKKGLTGLLLLFSVSLFAQETVTEKFRKITTKEQADAFVKANADLKPTIYTLTYGKDSSMLEKRLLRGSKGDIVNVGYVTYKILEGSESVNYRSSYIFLDGAEYSPSQIDSLKKLIVSKANAGEPWDKLSDQYTMDGNTTKGDTGWFFGETQMPKEFQDAVKAHKLNEIFFVDVSDNNWHYIVKKTYDDAIKKEITILRANGR
ncbi:MAG: peptidylprolyl isomerase [Flavitalea sp.]